MLQNRPYSAYALKSEQWAHQILIKNLPQALLKSDLEISAPTIFKVSLFVSWVKNQSVIQHSAYHTVLSVCKLAHTRSWFQAVVLGGLWRQWKVVCWYIPSYHSAPLQLSPAQKAQQTLPTRGWTRIQVGRLHSKQLTSPISDNSNYYVLTTGPEIKVWS